MNRPPHEQDSNNTTMLFKSTPSISEISSEYRASSKTSVSGCFSAESISEGYADVRGSQKEFLSPQTDESSLASLEGSFTGSSASLSTMFRGQFHYTGPSLDNGGASNGAAIPCSVSSNALRPPPHAPFPTWRMSWNLDSRTEVERDHTLVRLLSSIDASLIRLLNSIDASLADSESGRLYLGTHRCTAHSLTSKLHGRHHETAHLANTDFREQTRRDASASKHQDDSRSISAKPRNFIKSDTPVTSSTQDNVETAFSQALGSEETGTEGVPSGLNTAEDTAEGAESLALLSSETVRISEELLGDFLPKAGSCSIHILVTRFWGAVDTILRVGAHPVPSNSCHCLFAHLVVSASTLSLHGTGSFYSVFLDSCVGEHAGRRREYSTNSHAEKIS